MRVDCSGQAEVWPMDSDAAVSSGKPPAACCPPDSAVQPLRDASSLKSRSAPSSAAPKYPRSS